MITFPTASVIMDYVPTHPAIARHHTTQSLPFRIAQATAAALASKTRSQDELTKRVSLIIGAVLSDMIKDRIPIFVTHHDLCHDLELALMDCMLIDAFILK